MTAMNRVEFSFNDAGHDGAGEVLIVVDGNALEELVEPIERPFWAAEQNGQDPAERPEYRGLIPSQLDSKPSSHFLGSAGSHLYCGPEDKTVLMGCDCGEVGCWPLMATIEVAAEHVRWSNFEQPFRHAVTYAADWDYDGFSLEFDRSQYEAALAALELQLSRR